MKTITITLTVPDGVEVNVQQGAPATVSSSAPQSTQGHDCPHHGPMEFKKGTSKAGNSYAGWFCAEEGCTTPPVWVPKR